MRPSSRAGKICFLVLQLLTAVIILFPVFYAVDMSFLPLSAIFSKKFQLPQQLDFSYYRRAFQVAPLFRYLFNTLLVAAGITVGQLLVGSLTAFAFSCFEFRGKGFLFMLVLATMMIPGESIAISNYLTMGDLGLLNTYAAMILPSIASSMSIFFMRQAFLQIPGEFYEVAKMEGCGNLRFLFTILIPLSKGSLGAIGIYTFINAWNAYMWPLLVTSTDKMRTIQIGLGMLLNAESAEYNMMMAGVVVAMIPTIIVFALGQRSILSGGLAGAVKG